MTELQEFGKNVWIVEGPLVRDTGFTFTTRMTVVRLPDGSLWLESPVPASFDTLKRITELGPVRYLVAATPRHVWRLEGWHTLFPEAELWACRKTLFTLQKEKLPFTGILTDVPPPGWADTFDQAIIKGNPFLSEVLFFHKDAGVVILGDIIQSNPILDNKSFRNALFKLEGVVYPQAGVGLDMRLTFINRNLARQSLSKVLAWDFDKLIIAHGPCVEKDAKQYVERAFQWLTR
jgi:hypothetical protein